MKWKVKMRKREMLSYEDKPIEEYEREENKRKSKPESVIPKSKKKTIAIIAVLLVAVVAVCGLWQYIAPDSLLNSVASSKVKGDGFPVKIEGKIVDESDTCVLNNNLAYISETQFQLINNTGGLVLDERIKFASSAMSSCNDYVIIYDRAGKNYEIKNSTGTLYRGEADDDIFSAQILENGCYALLTKKSGYTAKLTVFDNDHKQKYAYYFSECYTTDVALNKDATRAVVCGLDASDGSIVSKIYVLDFTMPEPMAKMDFKDNTIYDVSFLENENISAIGDKSTMIITSDYQQKYEFTYNGYNLVSKAVDKDGVFLSLSPFTDGKSCEIWYISQDALTTITKTGLSTESMDFNGKNVAILSDNKITTFNTATQTTIAENDAGIDAKSICFADDNTIYVVGISEIREVKLNTAYDKK
ncbi:MAG: DUF5711 family protein [Acutalibacteraceae bacterium]|nr:DUF5711 family protein [Acutalibacteraceae bacterium]